MNGEASAGLFADVDLMALAARCVAEAGEGEQIEVYAARGRSTSVRAFGGEVESLSVAGSSGVGIRIVNGHRQGFAHCGTLDEKVVAETLSEARDNALYSAEDPWVGLADPDGREPPDLCLVSDELRRTTTDEKVAMALELERATIARDRRVQGVRTASYGDGEGEVAIASSTGLLASGEGTVCHLAVSALASEGDETTVGSSVGAGRGPGELDVEAVAGDAAHRATRILGAEAVSSRRLAVVLEPRVAATLLAIVGGSLTGERVAKGRTPFAERVGEGIASPQFSLVDDPTDSRSFGADTHDGEGLACRRNVLVSGGVLQGFLHNVWTARRLGAASTASAVRSYRSTPSVGAQALTVEPGPLTSDEIIAGVSDGILVQSLSGVHSGVNGVTGDVSVGAEGLMIRDGHLVEPVKEVTLAGTLQRMLLGVTAVGSDMEWLPGGTGAATIMIDEMVLSGR